MQLHLNNDESINLIHSYQNAQIRIGGQHYTSGVIVTPQSVHHLELSSVEELNIEHFKLLIDQRPEIAILGTGATQIFPDLALTQALISQQIGLEVMASKAACRTYNVLASDGRKVVALILC